jgi:hypothetical protein
MWAITRSGLDVAEWERVERCFHVKVLRRLRVVAEEMGEDAKGAEEDMFGSCYRRSIVVTISWCETERSKVRLCLSLIDCGISE